MIRLSIVVPFALAGALAAQQTEGEVKTGEQKPAPAPIAQPVDNAAVDRPLTPQEREEKLRAELARLEKELAAVKMIEETGGLPARVQSYLQDRAKTAQIITSTMPTIGPSVTATGRKGARLLGDAEKAGLPADVIFTVNGKPVTRAEFDTLFQYLKGVPHDQSDESLKQRVVLELVRAKAGLAAFGNTGMKALEKIHAAAEKLKGGADFAEVAKEYSDCPSKDKGGDLGLFGREDHDLLMTMHAFTGRIGATSEVLVTEQGYVIVRTTGYEKAASADADKVRASRILASYTPDVQAQRDLQMKLNSGGVDLGFVSDEFRKFTPDSFKK